MNRGENNKEREQCVDLGDTKESERWNDELCWRKMMVVEQWCKKIWHMSDDVVKKWEQNTSIIDNDFMCGSSWI
jgi:hypothetical protein